MWASPSIFGSGGTDIIAGLLRCCRSCVADSCGHVHRRVFHRGFELLALMALAATSPRPLIPEKYLDAPSQRLYYLSLGLLCQVRVAFRKVALLMSLLFQAIKLVDILWYWTSGSEDFALCRKWLLVDFTYIVALRQLRIPRLTYSRSVVLLQIALLWFFDSVFLGGITVNTPLHAGLGGRHVGKCSIASSVCIDQHAV